MTAATCSDDDLVVDLCRRATVADGDVAAALAAEVRRLAPLRSPDERELLVTRAMARINGLGMLDELLADPGVDEVLVNGGCEVWVDRGGTIVEAGRPLDQPVEHLLERILAPIGRRIDRTSPIVDARLGDGSRVCAVLPPVAVGGPVLSIRKFATSVRALDEFTDEVGADLVRQVVGARCNVIVSGATSSGKSSLLAALLDHVDDGHRVLVVEDTSELVVRSTNSVRLEARPPSSDGPPPITLADLVRTALRLRPDRIVVGEVRGDEVIALVHAMNTGHDGSLSTCHANSAVDALLRLEALVLQAAPAWPLSAIRQHLRRSIDVVVHLGRDAATARRSIDSIVEVIAADEIDDETGPRVRPLALNRGDGSLRQVGELTRQRDARP